MLDPELGAGLQQRTRQARSLSPGLMASLGLTENKQVNKRASVRILEGDQSMEENKPQQREGGGHTGSGGQGGLSKEEAFEQSPRCQKEQPWSGLWGEDSRQSEDYSEQDAPANSINHTWLLGEQQLLGCSFPAPASALCMGAGVGWGGVRQPVCCHEALGTGLSHLIICDSFSLQQMEGCGF